jgi:hypothetical protein
VGYANARVGWKDGGDVDFLATFGVVFAATRSYLPHKGKSIGGFFSDPTILFSKIEYDEVSVRLIHKYLFRGQPVRDSEGRQFLPILEEGHFRPHLFLAVAAYFDRHAFRAKAKEVHHVDTVRLPERPRSERQELVCRDFGPVPLM